MAKIKKNNTETRNNGTRACENCKGGLRCLNMYSPCYLSYCGEYPGTGPKQKD